MIREINKRLLTKLPIPSGVFVTKILLKQSDLNWKTNYVIFYLSNGQYLILKCDKEALCYGYGKISNPCKVRTNSPYDFLKILIKENIISQEEYNKL